MITPTNGFAGTVSLAVTSLPAGLTCQSLASVTPPSTTSTLSCSATVAADYTLTVTGTSGSLSHATAAITFHVVDFSISPSSPVTVNTNVGVAGTQTITVTALNGFTGTVGLTASASTPGGLTCSPLTSVTPPATTSTLSCSATTANDFVVTVTGNSGSLSHTTASITFHVVAVTPADFTITATSPLSFTSGQAGVSTMVTVTGSNGFAGTVTLTATVVPSTGLNVTCPVSVPLPPSSARVNYVL